MRLAVFSDVHGNLEAFQAALADAQDAGARMRVFLGDLVGYGPNPEECVNLARSLDMSGVMGNHEHAIVDATRLGWFNPTARESLVQVRGMLSQESLEYLASLPLYLVVDGCRLVHGAPPDAVNTYFFELSQDDVLSRMNQIDEPLCLVGHTHELALYELSDDGIELRGLKQEVVPLREGSRYLVNAGSVGQPRDADKRAKYVILDDEQKTLEVRFVAYDAQTTARKIRERGLPEVDALRLL